MPFALHLQNSLRDRHCQVEWEFAAGDNLERVLARHLLAIEASADTELLTSILLLDESGQRILHGAAPSLPPSYCEAIHGAEIGPKAGSCGTAAYTGRPIYVTDVAIDPLWDDYRHLALPHGLRACWSTPIRNPAGKVIATFAIYHPTPRSPTPGEVEAIRLITDHIAQVIMWDRSSSVGREHDGIDNAVTNPVHVPLANDNRSANSNGDDACFQGSGATGRFRDFALKLDRYADLVTSRKFAAALKAAAAECRKLDEAAEDRHKPPKDEH